MDPTVPVRGLYLTEGRLRATVQDYVGVPRSAIPVLSSARRLIGVFTTRSAGHGAIRVESPGHSTEIEAERAALHLVFRRRVENRDGRIDDDQVVRSRVVMCRLIWASGGLIISLHSLQVSQLRRRAAAVRREHVAVEFDVGDGVAAAEGVTVAGERVGVEAHVAEGTVVQVPGG